MAEMDDKIRQLTEAMSDKDTEMEKLKETIRGLQEKAAVGDEKETTSVNSCDDKDDITEEAVEG